MDAHQIGQRLREEVLRDRRQGRPLDTRRLQALIADLCGEEQRQLIAPLRHLLLSAAFASAAGMDPPLEEGRHRQRLNEELTQMFAPALCRRMQPVLAGLLGGAATQPAASLQGSSPHGDGRRESAAVAAAAGSPPSAQASQAPAGRGADTAVNAVLAFLSGMLLMALAGVGLMAWQRASGERPEASATINAAPGPAPSAPAAAPAAADDSIETGETKQGTQEGAAATAAETPPPPALPPAEQPAAEDSAAGEERERAVASLQQLYAALSAKDFNQAKTLFAGAAADQFGPGFFRQFERVSVQDLNVTSRSGTTLNLEGVVTFVWPDGSVQKETRSFSVDTSSDPAVVSASEFGRVLSQRQ